MSKHEKLLARARNNPLDLTFSEFQTLMTRCGWVLDHQNRGEKAKGYQVKQFLALYEEENKHV